MSISEHKHMPEPARRMEVFTGAGRRRSWSRAEKAAIIAKSYGAEETVCGVARRHGLTPQQHFAWRRRLARRSPLGSPTMFVPAVVEAMPREPPAATMRPRRVRRRSAITGNSWRPDDTARANLSDPREAEMAYERLDEALRQLKADRERAEAAENQRQEAAAEARIRFARIKSEVIGPIFDEVVARLAAEGFFGETANEQNDASGPISLNVNLSDDEGFSRQGSLQVRVNPDKYTCEFGTSTMAKASSTSQIIFDAIHHQIDQITEELVRETAEQFVLDLIAGKLSR